MRTAEDFAKTVKTLARKHRDCIRRMQEEAAVAATSSGCQELEDALAAANVIKAQVNTDISETMAELATLETELAAIEDTIADLEEQLADCYAQQGGGPGDPP